MSGLAIAAFSAAGLLLAGVWLLLSWMRKDVLDRGVAQEQSAQQEEIIDDVEKANTARDRLRIDPDYAKRMRDKYRRK